jgi:hypothetical protein
MPGPKLVHDLEQFSLRSMTECGVALRKAGSGNSSMEDVAAETLEYLSSTLTFADRAEGACALARFFITQRYSQLPKDVQQKLAIKQASSDSDPACVLLIATRGFKPEWNERRSARNQLAIVLSKDDALSDYPMLAGITSQLDAPLETIQTHTVFISEQNPDNYYAFYLPDVLSASSIPAQDEFVVPNGVRAVVGYGGELPSGCLYTVVLFLRVAISRQVALAFRPFALNTKIALLPFDQADSIFQKGNDGRRH